MYKLKDLSYVINKYHDDVKERIIEGQERIAKELEQDVKSRAKVPAEATRNPAQFSIYIDSISSKPAIIETDRVENRVTSDMVVADGTKWDGVPIGAFLEWGTGELGYSTNDYPHGFPYTTSGPWDMWTTEQWYKTNTYGIPATPHFHPATQNIMPKFYEMIRKALKNE